MPDRFSWLAPMVLWPLARPLVPPQPVRQQGGGARRTDDEAMFAAIAFVLASGSAWRGLPRIFGVSWQTTHRRFGGWYRIGLFARVRDVAEVHGQAEAVHWAWVLAEAAAERGREGRETPPGPPVSLPTARTGPARRTAVRRYLPPDLAKRVFRKQAD